MQALEHLNQLTDASFLDKFTTPNYNNANLFNVIFKYRSLLIFLYILLKFVFQNKWNGFKYPFHQPQLYFDF